MYVFIYLPVAYMHCHFNYIILKKSIFSNLHDMDIILPWVSCSINVTGHSWTHCLHLSHYFCCGYTHVFGGMLAPNIMLLWLLTPGLCVFMVGHHGNSMCDFFPPVFYVLCLAFLSLGHPCIPISFVVRVTNISVYILFTF